MTEKKQPIKLSSILMIALLASSINSISIAKAENSLEKIQKSGVIKIGTEGTYAPFTFHDESGKLTGFDVEIAEEVAKRLKLKPEFIETAWDGIFAGLNSKRYDIVVNEVGINEERKAKYDFSLPYIVSSSVLLVNKSNETIKSFEDLKGKKAAQTLTSNFGKMAASYGAIIEQIDGFNQAVDLISSNRVDATINDTLSYLDFKNKQPNSKIKEVDRKSTGEQSAILINKGNNELLDAINVAITEMKQDGTYLSISKKWFGEDVSK